jgi:hypothetical protein
MNLRYPDGIAAARTMSGLEANAITLQHRLHSGLELAPHSGDDPKRDVAARLEHARPGSMRSMPSGRVTANRAVETSSGDLSVRVA